MSEEAEASPNSFGGLRKCLDVEAERAFLSSNVVNGLFSLGEWEALLGRILSGDVSLLRTPEEKRAVYHPVAWGAAVFFLFLMIYVKESVGTMWAIPLLIPFFGTLHQGFKLSGALLKPWSPELVPLVSAAAEVLRRLQKDLEPGAPVQLLLDGRPPRNALRKDRAKSEAAQGARQRAHRSGRVSVLVGERERVRLQVSLRQGLAFSWSDSLVIVSKHLTGLGVRGTKSKTKEKIHGSCRVELRGAEKRWALATDLGPEVGVKAGEGKWRLRTEKTGESEQIQVRAALEGAARLVSCLVRVEKTKEAGA